MRAWTWTVAAVLALAGCGPSVGTNDSGSGGSSGETGDADSGGETGSSDGAAALCSEASCQGDLQGQWDVADACITQTSTSDNECGEAQCSFDILEIEGSYEFDNSADMYLLARVEARCEVPKACYSTGACESDDDAECIDVGNACDCTRVFEHEFNFTGAYSTTGELQVWDGDLVWLTDQWCTDGDTLQIENQMSWRVPGYRDTALLRVNLQRR